MKMQGKEIFFFFFFLMNLERNKSKESRGEEEHEVKLVELGQGECHGLPVHGVK